VSRRTSSAPLAGEVEADYEALRRGAGVIYSGGGRGRDVLRVSGSDALSYLQGQCSQDLSELVDGGSVDALLLSPQGKLEALVRVTRIGPEELIVDVQAGYGEAVKARLDRFKLRVKAVVEPLPWSCVSLRGPRAQEMLESAKSPPAATAGLLVVPFEWNGVVGLDLLGEAPPLDGGAGVRVCGREASEAVRIEAGIPAMGTELDERTIAAEADLLGRCVSTTKGCYTGQELVARLEARGNRVARRLRGLVVEPDAIDGAAVESLAAEAPEGIRGSEIFAGGKQVGHVTSSAWSPSLGTVACLAYLHRDVVPPAEVEVSVPGARGRSDATKLFRATVRDLPLI